MNTLEFIFLLPLYVFQYTFSIVAWLFLISYTIQSETFEKVNNWVVEKVNRWWK